MPKQRVHTTSVSVYNLNKAQAEKDSLVFGAIMAGVKISKKPLKQGLSAMETPKAMCAVGSGLRGVQKTRPSDILTRSYEKVHGEGTSSTWKHQLVPLVRFATALDVSEDYACGVNDGFEDSLRASRAFYPEVDTKSLDYERGWHVGAAVAAESGF